MPQKPTLWQKLQSIFFPVLIRKGSSIENPTLELFYFRKRYILGSTDAIYSDGAKYRPLVAAFSSPEIKKDLAKVSNVLVLGAGLASAVHVLDHLGFHPDFTLVDFDKTVLDWAAEFLPVHTNQKINLIHSDAFRFIEEDSNLYDMIIVDIFIGREVHQMVAAPAFINNCVCRMSANAKMILNFIVLHSQDEVKVKAALAAAFTKVSEISFGLNRVYIATV